MATKGTEDKTTYIGDDASGCAEPLPSSTPHSEELGSLPPAKRQRASVISIPFLLSSSEDTTAAASNSDNADTERNFEMSDGSMYRRSSKVKAALHADVGVENEARALRIVEIMNDFRTLQVHIESLVTRDEATPPNQQSYNLIGYQLLRQCNAEAQTILALKFDAGNLGIEPGRIPDTEVQKATLQRYDLLALQVFLLTHLQNTTRCCDEKVPGT